jgi:glutamate carboxypeptidase
MRRRALPACLGVLLLAALASASQQAPASRVDAGRLMADVETLASPQMEGRLTGTDGNKRAQAMIVERFRQLKLVPLNGSYEQKFSFSRTRGAGKQEFPDATNLVGLLPGTDSSRFLLVTAHYDHLGTRNGQIYPGADDNASGIAAMLETARVLSGRRLPSSVLFVAFDAEELGLRGSRYFVERPSIDLGRITAVVNLDMVGRGDGNVLFVAGTSHYPALKPAVEAAAKGRSIDVRFGHDRPGLRGEDDWTPQSDHGSFHEAHVPFLYFGVENHADYHRPTDTPDKIPRKFFAETTELVISTVLTMADKTGREPAPAPAAAPGPLSSDEQAIVTAIDRGNGDALALLERVVNINSGSMNFAGVRAVGQVFRSTLDELGFTTRWVDGAAFNRAGHLVAERRGSGPRVLLIGHLDTVFESDSPFQKFERIDEKTARGPGIIDMKGGNVVMVQALAALKAAGALDNLHVTVVMTGDEELTGDPLSVAREALVAAAKDVDMAIGFEDGPGDPKTAVIARRGTTGWQLRVKAKPAHSSQIFRPDIGAGAIYEAARILNTFREQLAGEEHLTLNPGVMLGGTSVDLDTTQARGTAFGKENVIAEHTVVMGDLRTLSVAQLERAKARMREIVAKSLPLAEATMTFDEGYPPLAPTDGNRRLLALYDQASRDVGAGPVTAVNPDRAGAADVSFVAGHVKMILDGAGLMGHSDHTPQETADLSTLPSQTKRAAILLYRISKGAR